MKEKGGFAFISTVKLHFSLVFWVRNAWKMWFSRYRSKIKHFSLVSNPKYAGKVNFTVSKNKPTHFLHLCGNPSKKIVIYLWFEVIPLLRHIDNSTIFSNLKALCVTQQFICLAWWNNGKLVNINRFSNFSFSETRLNEFSSLGIHSVRNNTSEFRNYFHHNYFLLHFSQNSKLTGV